MLKKFFVAIITFFILFGNYNMSEAYISHDRRVFSYDDIDEIGGLPGNAYNNIIPLNYTYYKDSIVVYSSYLGNYNYDYYYILRVTSPNIDKMYFVAKNSKSNNDSLGDKALVAIRRNNNATWEIVKEPKWEEKDEVEHKIENMLITCRILADLNNLTMEKQSTYYKAPIQLNNIVFSMVDNKYPQVRFKVDVPQYKWIEGELK